MDYQIYEQAGLPKSVDQVAEMLGRYLRFGEAPIELPTSLVHLAAQGYAKLGDRQGVYETYLQAIKAATGIREVMEYWHYTRQTAGARYCELLTPEVTSKLQALSGE